MKLMLASEFAKKYFTEDSRPDLRTLRADVANHRLPGKIVGDRRVYIDVDAFEKTTGNKLADRVLERM